MINEDYDLIALPETCFDITPEKTEEMSIPNYSLLHSGRKDDKEGVAFYVKNSIKFKVIDMTESPGPISFEQLLSILKQCGKHKRLEKPSIHFRRDSLCLCSHSIGAVSH